MHQDKNGQNAESQNNRASVSTNNIHDNKNIHDKSNVNNNSSIDDKSSIYDKSSAHDIPNEHPSDIKNSLANAELAAASLHRSHAVQHNDSSHESIHKEVTHAEIHNDSSHKEHHVEKSHTEHQKESNHEKLHDDVNHTKHHSDSSHERNHNDNSHANHQSASNQPSFHHSNPLLHQTDSHLSEKDENKLYNAIILALIIGIIIIIASLIFLRPEPEYFTELYFTDHRSLPKYINEDDIQQFEITIANHEQGITKYQAIITAELYDGDKINRTISLANYTAELEKEAVGRLNISYMLPEFRRAKITTELLDKSMEIHYWVNSNKSTYLYENNVIAATKRLRQINISKQALGFSAYNTANGSNKTEAKIIIRAKGTAIPHMIVMLDGKKAFETMVNSTNYTNYMIKAENYPMLLDIVFDNDGTDSVTGTDRNLYIEYILVGDRMIKISDGVIDTGKNEAAFDCQNLRQSTYGLPWNGAARLKLNYPDSN